MAERATVMWFRRDLRLSDNPALVEAARSADRVVALFVLDPNLRRPAGRNRLAFMHGCLRALDEDAGGHLVIRTGKPAAAVRAVAREVGAAHVFCAEDFGPYGSHRDDEVENALARDDVELRRIDSPYAVLPGTLAPKSGDRFKVFTPFSRAWRAHGWVDPVARPRSLAWVAGLDSDGVPDGPEPTAEEQPEPGEAAARRRLTAFLDRHVERYTTDRNRPDKDTTSRLSPYLRWGCLHPRQALAPLRNSRGERTFANELCWREFYADVLHHRPDTARQAVDGRLSGMRLDRGKRADERFRAWCEGRTGFPIVDAGMRQLVAEGWMHNRVRMIVASFLVKDLHIDWIRGARFFMEHLVDGDLASNQHGWQWVAGTGTDAAPYFRVFNPLTQSTRFDPDGAYIRRWVPELRDVEGSAVHAPSSGTGSLFATSPDGYPEPIVDHAEEREDALRRYHAARTG